MVLCGEHMAKIYEGWGLTVGKPIPVEGGILQYIPVNTYLGASNMVKKFRKKPLVIEAVQFTVSNAIELRKWCDGSLFDDPDKGGYCIVINTLEGNMECRLYDWVIRGIAGEFYPCKPDIFEKTYEEVKD